SNRAGTAAAATAFWSGSSVWFRWAWVPPLWLDFVCGRTPRTSPPQKSAPWVVTDLGAGKRKLGLRGRAGRVSGLAVRSGAIRRRGGWGGSFRRGRVDWLLQGGDLLRAGGAAHRAGVGHFAGSIH